MQDRRPGEHDDRQATRIGRYLVEGELGRGGMGVVYLARDPVLERPIAIKVLPPATALDERWARRFVHEAKVLASLNHPNIATIHSLEEVEGRFFLTLELIEGDTLEKRLADGALPLDEVISIGLQIARALEAAHERGIVHRDLKPANVRITPAGLVKVLDFGIAKVTVSNSEAGAAATQEGPIGTPGYMSPEQIAGQPVSCQSDIWAFGCVLYECLAGRSAFGGRNLFEAMFRTTEREPDWGLLAEDVPEALVSLLRRCLAKDPRSRPDAMVAVRRELDELAVSRSGPAVRRAAGDGAEDAGPDGRHNLPQRLTAFIGRERQLSEIDTLVGLQRLVTLTGAGGSGKSRLAMEVAGRMLDRFADGIWLVELAPLTAGVAVVDAVAAVLDLKEQQGCSVGEALTANLAGRQLLLILDNCEHLLETCGALVVELLQAAADVRILATSREPLGVDGEHVYSLPHMIVPTCQQLSTEELAGCEAVQLFIDRATAALHGFTLTPERCAAISEICRRLDGMPLAIEIAAAMVKVLPVEEINARLGQSLRVLTRGSKSAPPRHRTLRATIEWSHALLTDVERTLFRRLAVFAGGWTLDAAEQVCAGESIEKWEVLDRFTRLVDKSLVEMDVERTEQAGRGRYRMLETVREYAAERLEESGEADRVRSRYRDYFLDLAHQAAAHKMDAAQVDWLSRLEREHDNLRAILDRAMLESTTGSDDPDWSGLRLAGDLGWYWDIRGLWTEGRRYLEALLRRPGAAARIPARALGLFWCGELARVAGDLDRARELLEQSLELRIELGDHAGAAASLNDLGNIANMCGDHELARRCYEDGLTYRRQIDDRLGIAVSLNNLGTLAWSRQDAETAVAYLGESLTLRRDLGDLRGVAGTLHNLGLIASARDDHAAARVHLIEATEIRRTLGDTAGLGRALLALSTVALKENDLDTARSLREESRTTFRELGDRFGSALAAVGLGVVLSRQGELERAQELFEESLALWRKGGDRRRVLETLISIAEVAADQGRPDRVHDALDEALSIARQLQDPGPTAGPLRAVAYLELDGDEPETAVILLGASESMREQAGLGLPADGAAQRDGALAEARARLGEAAADRAWATGRSMTAEDAIALAESRIVLRRPGRAPRRRG